MKNRFETDYTPSAVPLVLAVALGTVGFICVDDCQKSEERVVVRQGVLDLQKENGVLSARVNAFQRSGLGTIIQSCKMAYESCLNGGKLPEKCSLERENEACEAELEDVKSLDDLRCCHSIQEKVNSCMREHAECVQHGKITKL